MTKFVGKDLMHTAEELFPLNRSLTGRGNQKTLEILRKVAPSLEIKGFATGSKANDWRVPPVWECHKAMLRSPDGRVICNFEDNNLSLVGYSIPFSGKINLENLLPHLHSLPENPDAIPYVTSYYENNWGFCLPDSLKKSLQPGEYEVEIDTRFSDGEMVFGEIYIPGEIKDEILFSTYICHPSMANNEVSGPTVQAHLARFLSEKKRRYSYRLLFLPETIGPISYIAENMTHLKKRVFAGWVMTCVGDDRSYSFLPSRFGNGVSDQLSRELFEEMNIEYVEYSWLNRGSDERQYCSPGVDLSVSSIMRTKYWEYPEYHTSDDKLGSVVTTSGLEGAFRLYCSLVEKIETEPFPNSLVVCEPQLGKRGLYSNISKSGSSKNSRDLLNVWSFCDGKNTVHEIAKKVNLEVPRVLELLTQLKNHDLVTMRTWS